MSANARHEPDFPDPDDPPAAGHLRAAAEAMLLALVLVSPWPFGSVEPGWQFVLYAGLAVVTALWVAHTVVTRRLTVRPDAVSACLLGLILLTALQLVPLPVGVVGVISPARAEQHRTLRPEVGEVLPGEPAEGVARREGWLPLTIDRSATRTFLAQLLAVFLAYAATRNLVASKGSFRRLAWVAFAGGLALAVLALAQHFARGRAVVPWWEPIAVTGFGPFVNRDHYPFYLSLCAGLGLGLLLAAARPPGRAEPADDPEPGSLWDRVLLAVYNSGVLRSPRTAGLLAGLGLMVGSIPFSLSRGGVLALVAAAVVTAGVARLGRKPGEGGRLLFVVLAGLVLGLVAWFGWEPVVRRLGTLAQREAVESRASIWRSAWEVTRRFPLTGTGGGTFPQAEPAFRADSDAPWRIVNSAHTEYLEALAEGGVVRFALTVGLAAAALGAAVGGYRRGRNRTDGPLLLGAVFGLTAVAVHSAVDFGLHTPAVALLAAVVAGHTAAARERVGRGGERVRRSRRGSANRAEQNEANDAAAGNGAVLTGWVIYAIGTVLVLVGMGTCLTGWRDLQINRLRVAADRAARGGAPGAWGEAAGYLETATRVAPDDGGVWNELAAARLAAARDRAAPGPFAAAAGPVAFARPPEPPPADLVPGLKAARSARDLNPLLPGPHLRLGAHAHLFVRGEPAAAHFDRAKRVAPFDPDVWYLSGAAALARGEFDAAWADWRESLRRSPRRLGLIAQRAARVLPPDQVRTRILPDDPAAWAAATEDVFPDPAADPAGRRAWLRAAADRWAAGPAPEAPAGWVAWASALEQLGDVGGALTVWRGAVEKFPDAMEVRDRLAARLEAEELYEEAVPHLERLAAQPGWGGYYVDRLAAARHGVKLRRDIEGP
jgi:tetratricopeptide (TPR) repeat protein